MAWADLLAGLAFFLIFEGLFPFAAPQRWRRGVAALTQLDDRRLRTFALGMIIAGLTLLLWVRS